MIKSNNDLSSIAKDIKNNLYPNNADGQIYRYKAHKTQTRNIDKDDLIISLFGFVTHKGVFYKGKDRH